MGFRLSILALLAGVLWALNPVVDRGDFGCLTCHSPHNEHLGSCVGCHRGNPRTERIDVAHFLLIPGRYARFRLPESVAVKQGRKIVENAACRRCHTIGLCGNRLAKNLDRLPENVRPEKLAAAIRAPAAFMPDFQFSEAYVTRLVNVVMAADGAVETKTPQAPWVLHYDDRDSDVDNPFAANCAACHRVLTRRLGGLGQGNAGPDLSGLLTEFYPRRCEDGRPWDLRGLRRWLDNPRVVRKFARMPPVRLSDDRTAELARLFGMAL